MVKKTVKKNYNSLFIGIDSWSHEFAEVATRLSNVNGYEFVVELRVPKESSKKVVPVVIDLTK